MALAAESTVTPVQGAKLWPMSVEAYHVLGEAGVIPKNTELLYGLVYTKMPKSPYHAYLLGFLLEMVRKAAEDRYVRSEMPITCRDSEPEPDISVVNGTIRDFRKEHPHTAELVIEICVTSHDYDRSKLKAYAVAGVNECWLVLGPEKQIEVYSDPKNNAFSRRKVFGIGQALRSDTLPQITVNLSDLFAE